MIALHRSGNGCQSEETRNQVTATRRAMSVPCDRDAIIRHRWIAFLDEVRRHVRMLRARHTVALAGDMAAVEAHGRGGGFDLAAVVGVVADANQVDHDSV